MSSRKSFDHQPGPLPHIRTEGTSVTFQFDIAAVKEGSQLVIRCDENGTVWASIDPKRGQ